MSPLAERARKILQHEQRTNHADVAVKPGGLASFFTRWAADAAGHPQAQRLATMFADYAALDPMQRVARVRSALALLSDDIPLKEKGREHEGHERSHEDHENGRKNSPQRANAAPDAVGARFIAPNTAPRDAVAPRDPARSQPEGVRKSEPGGLTPGDRATKKTPSPEKPTVAPATEKPASSAKPLNTKASPPVGEYLLDADVTAVPSVGPVMAEKLGRLGIRTVRDLLYHLPREHLDFSALHKIADLPFDETVTTLGVVWEVENVRAGRVVRTIAKISDDSGSLRAVWFNQPYLQKQLPRGAQIVLTGVKQRFGNSISFTVKSHELPEQGDLINTGRLVPVYPLTEGLSAKSLRKATKWVADRCASLVTDYLPLSVRQSAKLMALPEALAEYHYPESGSALHRAHTRLAFDELFLIQLGMLARRANWRSGEQAPIIAVARGAILEGDGPTPQPPPQQSWRGGVDDRVAQEESVRSQLEMHDTASEPLRMEKGLRGGKREALCRDLRQKQTPAEEFFWELVRDERLEGYHFRRQHPLGTYIADFFCFKLRLVVELDGGVHADQIVQDKARDEIMEQHGLQVMRIKNEDFLADPEAILEKILTTYAPSHQAQSVPTTLPLSSSAGEGAGGWGLWGAAQLATATCFEESLPFALTDAQRRVIGEVLDDMARTQPMIRLVQGDVGSGKTVVAAAALLAGALCGYQGAIMAPTEILAEQHVRGLTRMFAPFGIQVAGLLGNQRAAARREALAQVASGQAQVVVGTHAIIQEGVQFARLGVAVVDEQHRFGVEQREILRRKGGDITPHLLVMTATPIPRTLALSVYGDLDLSVIDQMPRGRLPIITLWRAGARREEAYALVAHEIAQGRQAYIICPLIEESEALEAKAAVVEFERLRAEVFPHLRLGLVHGGLKNAEKDATMRRFRDGEIDILVATAVVEVGVDVPNATVMLIEDADRFGLAQLHQFRGRVGRGEHQSYCYLLSEDASANARERLTAIESTTDGLKLAEEDLRLRGPGEFFGTRQSGLPELRVAELTDAELVALTRREAERLWQSDPFLHSTANRLLRDRVAIFWQGFMGQ